MKPTKLKMWNVAIEDIDYGIINITFEFGWPITKKQFEKYSKTRKVIKIHNHI